MADPHDTAAMAKLARQTLLEAVLPHVPPEQRYQTLMVANAIGIAGRALKGGAAALAAEADDYRRLLGAMGADAEASADSEAGADGEEGADGEAGADIEDVDALRRRLAAAIRSGALDDNPALVALLRRRVAARLTIANPAYLTKTQR